MQIIILIILLCLGSLVIPKKNLIQYLIVAVVMISSLFFFFWPDNAYDLYRYYLMLKHYDTLSFLQAIGLKDNTLGSTLTELSVRGYVINYKVYSLFAWLISKVGLYQLLGVISCAIVYGLMCKQIINLYTNEKMRKATVIITMIFCLLCYNVINLSLIRQALAYAVFAYVLYWDMVKQENKIGCFIVYILLCLVHSTGIMLLGFRLLIIVYKKISAVPIIIGFFLVYSAIPIVENLLVKYKLSFLREFLVKIVHYLVDRAVLDEQHVSLKATMLYIFLFLVLLYFMRYSRRKKEYKEYSVFIIFILAFCIPMVQQADIFNRFQLFLPIVFIPIIMELLEEFLGNKIISIKIKQHNFQPYFGIGLMLLGCVVIVTYFIGTCNDSYLRAQEFFSLDNFMRNGNMYGPAYWKQ